MGADGRRARRARRAARRRLADDERGGAAPARRLRGRRRRVRGAPRRHDVRRLQLWTAARRVRAARNFWRNFWRNSRRNSARNSRTASPPPRQVRCGAAARARGATRGTRRMARPPPAWQPRPRPFARRAGRVARGDGQRERAAGSRRRQLPLAAARGVAAAAARHPGRRAPRHRYAAPPYAHHSALRGRASKRGC